jgi:hypothetical protein
MKQIYDDKKKRIDDVLRVEGVKASGFGIIPKLAMQDKRLTIEAKSIYSYFCSFAGAGTTAFPSVSKICFDLNIGEDRYYKHFGLLKKYGYILVEQHKEESGRFINNVYTLVEKPVIVDKEPNPDFTGSENPSSGNPSPENKGSNNNNVKINSNKINSNKNNQSVSLEKTGVQPQYSIIENVQKADERIKHQIGYDELLKKYINDLNILDEVVLCIVDMYYSRTVIVNGDKKPQEIIRSVISKVGYWNIEYVLERFMEYREPIKNKKSFMQSMIYNSVFEIDLHYKNMVNAI